MKTNAIVKWADSKALADQLETQERVMQQTMGNLTHILNGYSDVIGEENIAKYNDLRYEVERMIIELRKKVNKEEYLASEEMKREFEIDE